MRQRSVLWLPPPRARRGDEGAYPAKPGSRRQRKKVGMAGGSEGAYPIQRSL